MKFLIILGSISLLYGILSRKIPEITSFLLKIGLIIAILTCLCGFFIDYKNTLIYGGVDLRSRITGARLLLKGICPYTYKWDPRDSDLLLDPVDSPDLILNRTAVSPSYLALFSPFSGLPYSIQRIAWLLIQWILLILSIALFAHTCPSKRKAMLVWIGGLFFISCGYFWRLHVERGQCYILYVFLLSASYWFIMKVSRCGSLVSGFLIGITTTLMPPMIFMNIPILVYKKWKLFLGNIIGMICGIIPSCYLWGIGNWNSFLIRSTLNHRDTINEFPLSNIVCPLRIEGMNNLTRFYPFPFSDASLWHIASKYLKLTLPIGVFFGLLILALATSYFFLCRYRLKNIEPSLLFLIGTSLIYISTFFVFSPRYSYTNTLWLLPLCLIIINPDSFILFSKPLIIPVITGLFFSVSLIPRSNLMLLALDYLTLFCSVFASIYFLCLAWHRQQATERL